MTGSTKTGRFTGLAVGSGILVAVLLAFPLSTGSSPGGAVIATLLIVVEIAAGAALWWILAGRCRPVELIGMGIAIGTALATVSGTLLAQAPGGSVAWALTLAVLVVVGAVAHWIQGGLPSLAPARPGTRRAVAIGAVLAFTALVLNVAAYPLSTATAWTRFHSDMPYFAALADSFARFGPWDSILADGFVLRYHALAYAWAGQVTLASGGGPFESLTRQLPVVSSAGVVLLAIAFAQRLHRSRWLPTLAVVLVLLGGYVGATYGSVLNFDSPSQSMGAMWLMALVLAALSIRPRSTRHAVAWGATLTVLAFATTGGKVSSAAVGVAGVVAVAAVEVLRRGPERHRFLVAALAVVLGALGAYVLLLRGALDAGGLVPFAMIDRASSQQGLNPVPGAIGVVGGTLALALAIALRWAGVAWLATRPRWRWKPATVASVAMGVVSLAAMLVFNGGLNETWFAAGASAPLSVTTALGCVLAFRFLRHRTTWSASSLLVWSATAMVLLSAVTWLLWMTGPSGGNVWVATARWAAPVAALVAALVLGGAVATRAPSGQRIAAIGAFATIGLVLTASTMRTLGVGTDMVGRQPGFRAELFSRTTQEPVHGSDTTVLTSVSPAMLEAAAWVREQTGPDELMASPMTFSPLIPALTARQSYVSGIQFQVPYGLPGTAPELLRRADLVDAFLATPSPSTVAPLCQAGVTILWLPSDVATAAVGVVRVAHATPEVVIARPRCP